jgi:hypothetical protein
MIEHRELTLSGPVAIPQDRRIGNYHIGPILWAIVAGLIILFLTFLALGSASQVAAEDPLAAGVVLAPELTGIHGQKWLDFNADGKHTASEPGIPNWQIFLLGNGFKLTATTDISGFYTFDGIPAGAYTITEELPEGWEQHWPLAGSHRLNYDPAVPVTGLDFGNRPILPTGIYGHKFEDRNGNGQRDDGEIGLPGWGIKIAGLAIITSE